MAGDELNERLGDLPSDVRRALSHPYRRQILRILLVGGPMSSVEIADQPAAPCSAPCLARHVRVLSESSLVTEESVGEGQGMTEHFFSVAPLPDSIHDALSETDALDRGTGFVP